jgi:Fe-S-cluster containining protein
MNYAPAVPIFYECQRCTACCRWPGQVSVTDAELARLAAHKGLTEHEFIQRFMRVRSDRRGLSLAEKPNGECTFLEGNDCSIQSVKPQQCRDFPNLWNFPGFEKVCRAIPRLMKDEDYRRLLAGATGQSPDEAAKLSVGRPQ